MWGATPTAVMTRKEVMEAMTGTMESRTETMTMETQGETSPIGETQTEEEADHLMAHKAPLEVLPPI